MALACTKNVALRYRMRPSDTPLPQILMEDDSQETGQGEEVALDFVWFNVPRALW